MKKLYKILDSKIEIYIPDNVKYDNESALKDFLMEDKNQTDETVHTFKFKMIDSLSEPRIKETAKFDGFSVYETEEEQVRYIGDINKGWDQGHMRILHKGREHIVELKNSVYKNLVGAKTVLNAVAMEHLVLESNGVILHASYINHNGRAILFTAPSGTGKSTQAALWEKFRNAEIINGDRVAIRLINGKAYASGIPFAGSSNYCKNITLPIEAIVYLGQAQKTTIEKLLLPKAFRKVWEECTVNIWNKNDVESATGIVIDILKQIPVYYMPCTADKDAVSILEEELRKV